ncbi:hypothetical protein SAMN05216261_1186 [Algibacter luteus]|uniref:STAS/SEC14 domain-containing protein n=2 Tax=Algibacter luteus TaxID=1178825 RepID=A0A1M6CCV7_9FLAO|nr:hypothetical protein SAMN05216261_1186 [Algibacter luteus]
MFFYIVSLTFLITIWSNIINLVSHSVYFYGMISIVNTELYKDCLKEINYSFGNVFIFKEFVISQFCRGEVISWENQIKLMVEDIGAFYNSDGSDVVYISNRINSYSLVAADWLKFYKSNYKVKAYCVVSQNKAGYLNSMIEKLFFKKEIRHFSNLYEAVNYVKQGLIEIS